MIARTFSNVSSVPPGKSCGDNYAQMVINSRTIQEHTIRSLASCTQSSYPDYKTRA